MCLLSQSAGQLTSRSVASQRVNPKQPSTVALTPNGPSRLTFGVSPLAFVRRSPCEDLPFDGNPALLPV